MNAREVEQLQTPLTEIEKADLSNACKDGSLTQAGMLLLRRAFFQLSALQSENEKLRAQVAWQLIETAPRDGTDFLAWCIERPPWSALPEFIDVACWHASSYEQASYFASRSGAIPTHWMPLPSGPSRREHG